MPDLPQTSHIKLELRDAVLHLWLNRPEQRNALSSQMVSEIAATFAAIAADRSVRVVVLREPVEPSAPAATSKTCPLPSRRRRPVRPTI